MNLEEKAYLYWLCSLPCLGGGTIQRLGEYFGGYKHIYNIEETRLAASGLLTGRQLEQLVQWKKEFLPCMSQYETLEERRIQFVTPLDPEYPSRLLEIYDPPAGLFIRGKLPREDQPSVAIVGARGCSSYGEQVAEAFASALARAGAAVISGLAAGIDGAAHRGALKAAGLTCGVLGCGINICYPSSNYLLYREMEQLGGICSEYPEGTKPRPFHFPRRNRIISGLADVILVVEAKKKSGSLITAELGLEQGREIFAVPGRTTDYLSEGCNRLIQEGAHVALSPADILECLGIRREKALIIHEKNINGLAKREKLVYSFLDFKPKHLDEISSGTGIGVSECMGILLELELGGYVFRTANHYYGKKSEIWE